MPKSPALSRKILRRLDITRRSSEALVRPPSPTALPSLLGRHSVDYNDGFGMVLGTMQISLDTYHKQYEQGELLGQGATSTVYEVKEKSTGLKYAVKVIPRKKILSNMFPVISKEIAILKRLNHKNIIKMHDTLITEENLYIVTDLVRGPELFDVIVDRKCFSEAEGRELIHRILDAVSHLHSQHITHGDIKPENIKYESTSLKEIKLLDFGFARLVNSGDDGPQAGTLAYEAPEVLLGAKGSFAADMWAIGVVAYILLCGFPPFFCNSEYERDHDLLGRYPFWVFINEDSPYLRNSVIRGQFTFPSSSWSNITDEAMDFVSRLLKVKPEERLTAEQALDHPWFKVPVEAMASLPDQASMCHFSELSPQEVLSKFLLKRPTVAQLEQAHILLSSPHISSRLAAKQYELLKAERRDTLRHHLIMRLGGTRLSTGIAPAHILCI